MIIGHSLIAITGAFLLYDLFRFKNKKQKSQELKSVEKSIKLCITGGPCGGKSQGINCIYNTFKQIAAPFFIVPEAATIIGSAGLTLDLSNFAPKQIELFQIYLMRLQYNLQMIIEDVAKTMQKLGKCPVILCDRGLLDGKAYAGKQNWARMLKQLKITQQDILSRYKAVLHMQTAARGASSNYFYIPPQQMQHHPQVEQQQIKGNKVRKQPPQLAIQLDQKIQDCYCHHPFRFIIRNYFFVKDFDMKTVLLVAQVNQILQFVLKKINIESYYSEYQKVQRAGRKISEEEIQLNTSPYLIRKRKYQKFLSRQRSGSPARN